MNTPNIQSPAQIKPLEEDLCYMFQNRAPRLTSALPNQIHEGDCTRRNAALWMTRDEMTEARNRYVGSSSIPNINLESQRIHMAQRMTEAAVAWRIENGIFSRDIYRPTASQKDAAEATLKVAAELSDEHWFFGVIGELDLFLMQMNPPMDKTLTSEEARNVAFFADPAYKLPEPRDVKPLFTIALEKLGRRLPKFQEWLGDNLWIYSHFWLTDCIEYVNSRPKDKEPPQIYQSTCGIQ